MKRASFAACFVFLSSAGFFALPFVISAQTSAEANQKCATWWNSAETQEIRSRGGMPTPPTCSVKVSGCSDGDQTVSGRCDRDKCSAQTACGKPLEGKPDQNVDSPDDLMLQPPEMSSGFVPSNQPLTTDPNKFTPTGQPLGTDPDTFMGKPFETLKTTVNNLAPKQFTSFIADSFESLGEVSSGFSTNPNIFNSDSWSSFSPNPTPYSNLPVDIASVRPVPLQSGFNATPLFSPDSYGITGGGVPSTGFAPPAPSNNPFPWQPSSSRGGFLNETLPAMWESAKDTAEKAWQSMFAALTPASPTEPFAENPFGEAAIQDFGEGVSPSAAPTSDEILDSMGLLPTVDEIAGDGSRRLEPESLRAFADDVAARSLNGEVIDGAEKAAAVAIAKGEKIIAQLDFDNRGAIAHMMDFVGLGSEEAETLAAANARLNAIQNPLQKPVDFRAEARVLEPAPATVEELRRSLESGELTQGAIDNRTAELREDVIRARASLAVAQANFNDANTLGNRLFDSQDFFSKKGIVANAQAELAVAENEYLKFRQSTQSALGSNVNTKVPGRDLVTNPETFGAQGTRAAPEMDRRIENQPRFAQEFKDATGRLNEKLKQEGVIWKTSEFNERGGMQSRDVPTTQAFEDALEKQRTETGKAAAFREKAIAEGKMGLNKDGTLWAKDQTTAREYNKLIANAVSADKQLQQQAEVEGGKVAAAFTNAQPEIDAYVQSSARLTSNEEGLARLRERALAEADADASGPLDTAGREKILQEVGARSTTQAKSLSGATAAQFSRWGVGDAATRNITGAVAAETLGGAYVRENTLIAQLETCSTGCDSLRAQLKTTREYIVQLQTGNYSPELGDYLAKRTLQTDGNPLTDSDSFGARWRAGTDELMAGGVEVIRSAWRDDSALGLAVGGATMLAGGAGQVMAFMMGEESLSGHLDGLLAAGADGYGRAISLNAVGTALGPIFGWKPGAPGILDASRAGVDTMRATLREISMVGPGFAGNLNALPSVRPDFFAPSIDLTLTPVQVADTGVAPVVPMGNYIPDSPIISARNIPDVPPSSVGDVGPDFSIATRNLPSDAPVIIARDVPEVRVGNAITPTTPTPAVGVSANTPTPPTLFSRVRNFIAPTRPDVASGAGGADSLVGSAGVDRLATEAPPTLASRVGGALGNTPVVGDVLKRAAITAGLSLTPNPAALPPVSLFMPESSIGLAQAGPQQTPAQLNYNIWGIKNSGVTGANKVDFVGGSTCTGVRDACAVDAVSGMEMYLRKVRDQYVLGNSKLFKTPGPKNTPLAIGNEWAPKSDGNASTYGANAAKIGGLDPAGVIAPDDVDKFVRLMKGQACLEQSFCAYEGGRGIDNLKPRFPHSDDEIRQAVARVWGEEKAATWYGSQSQDHNLFLVELSKKPYGSLTGEDLAVADRAVQKSFVESLSAKPGYNGKVLEKPLPPGAHYVQRQSVEKPVAPVQNMISHVAESRNASFESVIAGGEAVETRGITQAYFGANLYIDNCAVYPCRVVVRSFDKRTNSIAATEGRKPDAPDAYNWNSIAVEVVAPSEARVTDAAKRTFGDVYQVYRESVGSNESIRILAHDDINYKSSGEGQGVKVVAEAPEYRPVSSETGWQAVLRDQTQPASVAKVPSALDTALNSLKSLGETLQRAGREPATEITMGPPTALRVDAGAAARAALEQRSLIVARARGVSDRANPAPNQPTRILASKNISGAKPSAEDAENFAQDIVRLTEARYPDASDALKASQVLASGLESTRVFDELQKNVISTYLKKEGRITSADRAAAERLANTEISRNTANLIKPEGYPSIGSGTQGESLASYSRSPNEITADTLVDDYLWSAYQRSYAKIDSGGDFTFKDIAGALNAKMSVRDYVIGGMNRDMKTHLYAAGKAMDKEGIEWSFLAAYRGLERPVATGDVVARNARNSQHYAGGFGEGNAADIGGPIVPAQFEARNGAVVDVNQNARYLANKPVWDWLAREGGNYGLRTNFIPNDPAHVQPRGNARILTAQRARIQEEVEQLVARSSYPSLGTVDANQRAIEAANRAYQQGIGLGRIQADPNEIARRAQVAAEEIARIDLAANVGREGFGGNPNETLRRQLVAMEEVWRTGIGSSVREVDVLAELSRSAEGARVAALKALGEPSQIEGVDAVVAKLPEGGNNSRMDAVGVQTELSRERNALLNKVVDEVVDWGDWLNGLVRGSSPLSPESARQLAIQKTPITPVAAEPLSAVGPPVQAVDINPTILTEVTPSVTEIRGAAPTPVAITQAAPPIPTLITSLDSPLSLRPTAAAPSEIRAIEPPQTVMAREFSVEPTPAQGRVAETPIQPDISPQRELLVATEAQLDAIQRRATLVNASLMDKKRQGVAAGQTGGLEGFNMGKSAAQGVRSDVNKLARVIDELSKNPLANRDTISQLNQEIGIVKDQVANLNAHFNRSPYLIPMTVGINKFAAQAKSLGQRVDSAVNQVKQTMAKVGDPREITPISGGIKSLTPVPPSEAEVLMANITDSLRVIDSVGFAPVSVSRGPFDAVVRAVDVELVNPPPAAIVVEAPTTPATPSSPNAPAPVAPESPRFVGLVRDTPRTPSAVTAVAADVAPPPNTQVDLASPSTPSPFNFRPGRTPQEGSLGELGAFVPDRGDALVPVSEGFSLAALGSSIGDAARSLRGWFAREVLPTDAVARGSLEAPTITPPPLPETNLPRAPITDATPPPLPQKPPPLPNVEAPASLPDALSPSAPALRSPDQTVPPPLPDTVTSVVRVTDDVPVAEPVVAVPPPLPRTGASVTPPPLPPSATGVAAPSARTQPDLIAGLNSWSAQQGTPTNSRWARAKNAWGYCVRNASACLVGIVGTGSVGAYIFSGGGEPAEAPNTNTSEGVSNPAPANAVNPQGGVVTSVQPASPQAGAVGEKSNGDSGSAEEDTSKDNSGDSGVGGDGSGANKGGAGVPSTDGNDKGGGAGGGLGSGGDAGADGGAGPRPSGANQSGGFSRGGMSLLQGLMQGLFAFFGQGGEDEEDTQPRSPQPDPAPIERVAVGAIVSNPSLIDAGSTTTISWSSVGTDVGSSTCAVINADFSVLHRGPQNGSISSGVLTESTRFGLVCNTKNATDKLLHETLVRVRGDDSDPERIFTPEEIAASQSTPANTGAGGASSGGGSGGGGGQSGNPTPQDVRTCEPEQPINSFILCLCEAEPNPAGCAVPAGGLR